MVLGPVEELRLQHGKRFIAGETKGFFRSTEKAAELKRINTPVKGRAVRAVSFLRNLRRHDEDCMFSAVTLIQINEPDLLWLLPIHLREDKFSATAAGPHSLIEWRSRPS